MRVLLGLTILAVGATACSVLTGLDDFTLTGGAGGSTTSSGGTGGVGGAGGAGGTPCVDVDADGDGMTGCAGDCDDGYALAYQDADEICDGADNDCDGQGDPSSCTGVGTFVAPYGNDANPGTKALPVLTIAQGIANAQLIGGGIVYIAEGFYGEAVVLPPGVSLRGGHAEPTWQQDPVGHASTIDCDAIDAYVCVRAGAGVVRDNVIDGLTIQGATGEPTDPPGSVALQLDSASPTVTRCRILGGDVTGMVANAERSIAVQVLGQPSGPGPLIEGNEIAGGDGPNDASIGVLIEAGAAAEIVDNDIRSGPGLSSWGVMDNGATAWTELVGNRIQAGDAATAAGASFGIATRGSALIARNFVNTDQSDPPACAGTVLWCGGIASYSSAARIENNVVFGAQAMRSAAVHLLEITVPTLSDVHVNANYLNALGNASAYARSAAVVLASPYAGASMSSQFAVIRNNILIGGLAPNQYGIYEDSSGLNQTCTPKAFTNNLIFFESGMSGVLYRQWNGTMETNIGVLANLPAEYTNNLNEDPRVDATYHLMAGSPCIDAGTHLDAPNVDFEGDARPLANPVDIGPDEAQ